MAGFDGDEFGRQIVEAVNASIERSIAPLLARLDKLEAVNIKEIVSEEVKDIRGAIESVVMPEMQEALAVMVREAVPVIPEPVDLSPIQEQVRTLIAAVDAIPAPPVVPDVEAMIKAAIDALPAPVNLDPVNEQINELRETVKAIPAPPVIPELPDVAGMIKSAIDALPAPVVPELPDIPAMIKEAVDAIEITVPEPELPDFDAMVRSAVDAGLTKGLEEYRDAINALPVPQDGKSVTVDDARPLIEDAVSKAVAQIPVPKDGRDGCDAMDSFINKDGHLVITFSDGRVKDVGQVVGDDGVDVDFERVNERIAADIKALFEAQPKPRDGFGFDDMRFEYDGERSFKLVFQRGDHVKEFPFTMPVILDRGVYSEGKTYQRGDCVTWGGSRWIAQKDAVTVKPDDHKGDWLLSVKRGQPGKNGQLIEPRPNVPVKLGRN